VGRSVATAIVLGKQAGSIQEAGTNMAGGDNPIKPGHRGIKAYYEELARYANQDVKHETAVRSAFQNLLAEASKKRRWTRCSSSTS